jgi:SAM-dependent methyltransferase
MAMTFAQLREQVTEYYTTRVEEHGPTARGVDWNSPESQTLRFAQLLKLLPSDPCSLLDYGCGYGALVDYLADRRLPVTYIGFDSAPAMIARAVALHPPATGAIFVSDEPQLTACDYAVASGVLNVKLSASDDEWNEYMKEVVDRLASLSTRGFAFNVLSRYSDPEKRRPSLHYADPHWWFDYCKRRFAGGAALLHDYPLYEFTLLVRH